ncbi:hypothetical protein BD560DRAFT_428136 [Blakeslea trispora]|nr:hypothetical protein BD560DRAFT_428136 [Blakeslea trispora]
MNTLEKAQNDLKKLKSKYASQLATLKELFTDWTDDDLVVTLQDADGDLELTIDRISEGHASQWGEVKTKKSKKEAAQAAAAAIAATTTTTTTTTTTNTNLSTSTSTTTKSNDTLYTRGQKPKPRSTRPLQNKTWSTKKPEWTSTQKTNEHWSVESAKKPSSQNGAKTWASLLQSKPSVESPPLQKVDDTWLTPNTTEWNEKTISSPPKEPLTTDTTPLPDFSQLSLAEESSNTKTTVHDLFNSVKEEQDKQQLFSLPEYHHEIQQDYSLYRNNPTLGHFQTFMVLVISV